MSDIIIVGGSFAGCGPQPDIKWLARTSELEVADLQATLTDSSNGHRDPAWDLRIDRLALAAGSVRVRIPAGPRRKTCRRWWWTIKMEPGRQVVTGTWTPIRSGEKAAARTQLRAQSHRRCWSAVTRSSIARSDCRS